MGYFNFPHTRTYDTDLGFLIKRYLELKDIVDKTEMDLNDRMDKIEQEMSDIVGNIQNLVKSLTVEEVQKLLDNGTFETIINNYINNLANKTQSTTISKGTLQRLINVATSYLKHTNDIVYGHKRPAEPEEGVTYGNSAFDYINGPEYIKGQYDRSGLACNCTTFALLTTMGVPYEYSAYNPLNGTGNNQLGIAGYCYNIYREAITKDNYELYYNTQRMYQRYVELGVGQLINPDYSNVNAGDVVWFTREKNNVDQIYHCAVILGRISQYQEGNDTKPVFILAECVNAPYAIKIWSYTSSQLVESGVNFVGHPQYQYTNDMESEVIIKMQKSQGTFNAQFTDLNIQNCEVITIDFDFIPTQINQYIAIYGNDNQLINGNRIRELTELNNVNQLNTVIHHSITIPFMLASQTSNAYPSMINKIGINVVNNDGNSIISNLKIYRGLPSREKLKVIRPTSLNDLNSLLLSIVPQTNVGFNDSFDLCLIPQASIQLNDSITLQTNIYYGKIYTRSDSNQKRLVYRFIQNNQETTILYYNNNWTYKQTIVTD